MLHQGKSYEKIKKKLKVSSATISSVNKQIEQSGTQLIINKLKINDWASRWAKKIVNWLHLR